MKFLIATNDDKLCLDCRSNILYGEHYLQKYSYKAKRSFFFHIDCYRKWSDNNIVKFYLIWRQNLDPPKIRGRPKKYKDGKKAHRLKALIRYHREAGNEDRVEELRRKLDANI